MSWLWNDKLFNLSEILVNKMGLSVTKFLLITGSLLINHLSLGRVFSFYLVFNFLFVGTCRLQRMFSTRNLKVYARKHDICFEIVT